MTLMRSLFRGFFLVLLAVGVLAAMWRWGLIDFALIRDAFRSQLGWLLAVVAFQFLTMFLLAFRFVATVRAFCLPIRVRDMLAATFVSTALGQWAPGSLAFMEAIRLGLMLGTGEAQLAESDETESQTRQKIVVASIYDRLIGFWVILCIGFMVTLAIGGYAFWNGRFENFSGVLLLLLFSGCGAAVLSFLPVCAKWSFIVRILHAIISFFGKFAASVPSGPARRVVFLLTQIFRHAESLREVLATGGRNYRVFSLSALLGLLSVFSMTVVTYFSAIAIGAAIPFFAIAAALPVIAVAALLPLGFAGMGAYQLVTVLVFNLFAVDPKIAASANLLQNALSLMVCTVLGVVFAKVSLGTLRKVLRHRSRKC